MTTLYIAGPMRGYPRYNYAAFDHAAERLRSVGYDVVSPAELDVHYGDLPGFDLDDPDSFTQAHWHVAMRRDLLAIIGTLLSEPQPDGSIVTTGKRGVDGVATLDGWKHSRGARAEVYVAQTVGLRVDHWERFYADGREARP